MNDVILAISALSKRFKAVQALTDVSFEVREGESVGLIGPNGSGKTTLFNCVAGYHKPTTGTVWSFGQDITGVRPQRLATRGIVRTFQHAETFASETVLWNVRTAGRSLRKTTGPRGADLPSDPMAILELCDLADAAHATAGDLSYGQAKRLGVAVGLAVRPRLLMLDEPASGLNDSESLQLARILGEVNRRGVTLLVIDHDMPFLLPIVSRVVVLDAGRKLAEGAPDTVREDRAVVDAYLGHGFEPKAPSTRDESQTSGEPRAKLVVSDVRSGYVKNDVLRGVSMEVGAGEAVAVLGANGAGKTTLIRTVSGVLPTRSGEVSIGNTHVGSERRRGRRSIGRWMGRLLGSGSQTEALSDLYNAGLVHVPEGRHIFTGLSVRDNLLAVRPRKGHGGSQEKLLAQMTDLFPVLKEKLDLPGDSLSGGQQQMLAIARGLMADPALLCIDEPSLGLAPTMMETLTAQVAAVQGGRLSLLIVEQSAAMALALSDRVYVMRNGRLVHESASHDITPSELMANYLGA
jgi:branched-chain amino acid transport system ATP-binding protein